MGRNTDGELGVGDYESRKKPVALEFFDELGPVSLLRCGAYSTGAVCDGKVYLWGEHGHELGNDGYNLNKSSSPVHIDELDAEGEVEHMVLGWAFCLVLIRDQGLFVQGKNSKGQLGMADTTAVKRFVPHPIFTCTGSGNDPVDVGAGYDFSVVLTRDGSLLSFGCSDAGQLGADVRGETFPLPLAVTTHGKTVESVVVNFQSLLVRLDGEWFGAGDGLESDDMEKIAMAGELLPWRATAAMTKAARPR
jgi:alpha-tubulin suppressor-like RCC1 family protein